MNQLMALNGEMTMGTREIAELLGKQHHHIKGSANYLVSKSLINGGVALTETPYVNEQNKQTYTEYRLNKRDSIVLVAQNSPEFTARLVDRWAELEEKASTPALPDFNDPIAAARAWADAKEQALIAEKQLAIAAPKAEFVDKFVESSGLFGFRQVAKTLGVKENWLREFLQEKKIMYYLKGKLTAYANHIDAGRFQSRVGVADNGHNFNECKFTAKGVEWIAALIAVEKVKAQ